MTHLLGENIYIYAVSKKGRTISVRLTLEEARRLAKEIQEQIEAKRRVKEVIAFQEFRAMLEAEEG